MELFLPGKVRGSQTLDSWLASLRDRFPGFLRYKAARRAGGDGGER